MRKIFQISDDDTTIGRFFISPVKKLFDIYSPRLLPEKIYIKRKFKKIFGYKLNLKNPKTISEKLLWLRLNDRTPLHTLCTDKYTVREYIREKIGEQYLVPLIFHTEDPADIIPNKLPNYPFIIKTNHGSGRHIIVKDKSMVNWERAQISLKKLLKRNFYYRGREWQYKDIKPLIIVEKLLLDRNQKIPIDYKFMCSNGKVDFIEVLMDRFINLKIKFYDPEWNILDFKHVRHPMGKDIEKPEMLDKMIRIAEKLSKDFTFVRVDLYNVNDKIYFGELTFSPRAGFIGFNPPEWDRKFGNALKLNILNKA